MSLFDRAHMISFLYDPILNRLNSFPTYKSDYFWDRQTHKNSTGPHVVLGGGE